MIWDLDNVFNGFSFMDFLLLFLRNDIWSDRPLLGDTNTIPVNDRPMRIFIQ